MSPTAAPGNIFNNKQPNDKASAINVRSALAAQEPERQGESFGVLFLGKAMRLVGRISTGVNAKWLIIETTRRGGNIPKRHPAIIHKGWV